MEVKKLPDRSTRETLLTPITEILPSRHLENEQSGLRVLINQIVELEVVSAIAFNTHDVWILRILVP